MSVVGLPDRAQASSMRRMSAQAISFRHEGLMVHAAQQGECWRGELLDTAGNLHDHFTYTRDGFPGAVIGALRVTELGFAPQLAARLWLHTNEDVPAAR